MVKSKVKKGSLIAVSVALLISIAGCGTPANKNGSGAASSPDKASPAGKEISLVFSSDVYTSDDWAKISGSFKEKHPDIKVTYEQLPVDGNQRQDKVKTLYAANTVPDIIEFDNQTPWLPMYQDKFVALDDMIASDPEFKLETIYPGAIDFLGKYTEMDKIFALPGQINPSGMIYNKTLFDKFKVPYPTDNMSWKEVAELARKITREEDGQKYYGLWLSNWNSAFLIQQLMETQAGITETNYSKGEIFLDEALIKSIMESATEIQRDPQVTIPYAEFVGGKMPFDQFNQGNVAMWPEHLWTVTNLRMLDKKGEINFDWGVVTFPHLNWDNANNGLQPSIQPLVINTSTREKEAAFEFVKWYFSKDFQIDRTTILGITPSIVDKEVIAAFKKGEDGLENWENVIAQPYKTQIPNIDVKTSGYDEQYKSMSAETTDRLLLGSISIDEAIGANKETAKEILDSIGEK